MRWSNLTTLEKRLISDLYWALDALTPEMQRIMVIGFNLLTRSHLGFYGLIMQPDRPTTILINQVCDLMGVA